MDIIEEILVKQRAFFKAGHTLDVNGRRAALQILANTIKDMEGEIVKALQDDLGKSSTESYMCEIGLALSEIAYTRKHLKHWARTKYRLSPISQFPSMSYMITEPYGNALIMAPWNYPFLLCISPLVSALAAGNTAIIKPSTQARATQAVVKKVIEETFTDDYVAVLGGGREEYPDLLDHKFDYIFFTGSKTYGRTVMEKAAQHLTPVTLELGGKSPVVVDSQCDLQVAARRVVFGKFLNLGQTCVAPDHVFVQETVMQAFQDACITEIVAMFGSRALDDPDYGHIISRRHYDRIAALLEQSRSLVTFGGEASAESLQICPTILQIGKIEDRDDDGGYRIDALDIMQQEIFGPLLPLISYSDISDVVDYIDAHPRPLASYIFTSDKRMKKVLLRHLHFGGGCINDTIVHLATESMPFGGVGQSGMGQYHGRWGFETFSHTKSIIDKATWLDLDMRYQPYTLQKHRLIKRFLK